MIWKLEERDSVLRQRSCDLSLRILHFDPFNLDRNRKSGSYRQRDSISLWSTGFRETVLLATPRKSMPPFLGCFQRLTAIPEATSAATLKSKKSCVRCLLSRRCLWLELDEKCVQGEGKFLQKCQLDETAFSNRSRAGPNQEKSRKPPTHRYISLQYDTVGSLELFSNVCKKPDSGKASCALDDGSPVLRLYTRSDGMFLTACTRMWLSKAYQVARCCICSDPAGLMNNENLGLHERRNRTTPTVRLSRCPLRTWPEPSDNIIRGDAMHPMLVMWLHLAVVAKSWLVVPTLV